MPPTAIQTQTNEPASFEPTGNKQNIDLTFLALHKGATQQSGALTAHDARVLNANSAVWGRPTAACALSSVLTHRRHPRCAVT